MKGRIFFASALRSRRRGWHLCLLILLSVAAFCWGQRRPTGRTGRGRTSRTSQLKVIQLPRAATSSAGSVEAALRKQQNLEAPANLRLTFSEIGQLAWAAQGVAVPQAGAASIPDTLIPMKVYIALPDGIYLYSPSTHALQQLREGDLRAALASAVLNQQSAPIGGCQILLAGSSVEFSSRYGAKAKAAMLLLAGQMAQSIQLQAINLDLTYIAVNNVDALGVRRVCRLDRTLTPLYIAMVGYPPSRVTATPVEEPVAVERVSAKVVIVTPQREFQDEELFQTKFALEAAFVQTLVASTRSGRIVGMQGGVGQADLALSQVNVEDFDGLVFIGGTGAVAYANNARVQELARQAAAQNKVLAASGVGTLILANAGVLNSARVTGPAAQGQLLALAGAVYTGTAVEKDGSMITSTGPLVAPQFGRTIVATLASRQ